MKRILATVLAILLAAPPLVPAVAQAQDAVSVALLPTVGCMVAGTNPQIEAGISPYEQVQVGRVFFKSALGDSFYYVEMTKTPAGYVGVLPKPQPGAGPITYYVEGVTQSYAQGQSPEQNAIVVEQSESCKDRMPAAIGPSGPVRVFSTTGVTALPAGFTGVSSVVAGAGAAVGAGAAAGAAGGGGFLGGTIGVIAAAAVVVGVGAAVVVSLNDDNPPASPSR